MAVVAERHVESGEIDVRIGRRRVDVLFAERIVFAVGHGPRLAVDRPFGQHRNLDDAFAVEIHQRHGARLGERFAHGGVHDLPHGLLVGEFHLGFLRVDIDVDARRVDRQVEEIRRRTAFGNQLLVRLHDGAREVRTLEIAAVYEEVLFAVAPFGGGGTADVAFDAGDRSVGLDLQQILLDMASHHIDDTSGERRRTQRIDRGVVGV